MALLQETVAELAHEAAVQALDGSLPLPADRSTTSLVSPTNQNVTQTNTVRGWKMKRTACYASPIIIGHQIICSIHARTHAHTQDSNLTDSELEIPNRCAHQDPNRLTAAHLAMPVTGRTSACSLEAGAWNR